MDKNSPIKVYAIAGHIVWLIISPLLLFIGGGSWLVRRFELAEWLAILFVLFGLFVMVAGVWTYLKKLLDMYDDSKHSNPPQLKIDKRDYDYYDDNYRIK
ncbi:MAG: AtpZ/AtpI family protein [Oscillospiraceae bacterium]|nr:AtpZ/AtpI family protein [Oscillospiraceae bacterium]